MALLKQFRGEIAEVRVASILCEAELFEHCSDQMVKMLPQTIPFIAEAMEDDDERVTEAVQNLIAKIEGQVGESLQRYLV